MMRRICVVLVLLAAAVVVPSPAYAGQVITTVVSKSGLPAAIKAVYVSCPEPNPAVAGTPTNAFSHVFGQGFPPLGHGSLRINAGVNKLSGLLISGDSQLGALNTLSVGLDSELGYVWAHIIPNGSDWVLSQASQAFVGGWSPHDLSGSHWLWTNGTDVEGPGSVQDFVAAHQPSAAGFRIELLSGTCGAVSPNPSYFDNLVVGYPGSATKYNFESTTGGLTMTANHSTIAAGSSVTLSTLFKDGGILARGRNVELWAKKKGATHFTRIRILTTNINTAKASATLKPTKTTTYYWHHPLDASIQATSSPKKTITVTH